jgi:hypothetical protein
MGWCCCFVVGLLEAAAVDIWRLCQCEIAIELTVKEIGILRRYGSDKRKCVFKEK